MNRHPDSVIPDYLPTIFDPGRPDDDPAHAGHWATAWCRTHGFRPDAGFRNDCGDHLADALELQVAERTILHRRWGQFAGETRTVYRFLDCSGVILLDGGWLPLAPDGTTQAGRCEWIYLDD